MPMGKGTYGSKVGRPTSKRGGIKGGLRTSPKRQPRNLKPSGSRRNPRMPDNTTSNAMRRAEGKKFPKKKGGLKTAPIKQPSRSKGGLKTAPVKQPRNITGRPRSGVRTSTGSRNNVLYGRRNRLNKR